MKAIIYDCQICKNEFRINGVDWTIMCEIEEICPECKRLFTANNESDDQILHEDLERANKKLVKIGWWTNQFGSSLCPESTCSADTYGDGVRAAKKEVRKILEET